MAQPHLPSEHELARALQREVLRCAVIVAMARQQQQLAQQELQATVEAITNEGRPYPVGLDFKQDGAMLHMLQATAQLEMAVDQLTDACVEAQKASKAGGN